MMTPYAIESGDIRPEHLDLFRLVEDIVSALPDGLDCHQVCAHVAGEIPALAHVRGYFVAKGWTHSWLEVPGEDILIDAYPWAGSGPFMVTTACTLNPWRRLYVGERVT